MITKKPLKNICSRFKGLSRHVTANMIHIVGKDGKLTFSRTDCDTFIYETINADICCDILVDFDRFKSALEGKDEPVELLVDGENLLVKGKSLSKVPIIHEEFPNPDLSFTVQETLPANFVSLANKVALAAAKRDPRHFLEFVYLKDGLAATDGHRLHQIKFETKLDALVPAILIKLISKWKGEIEAGQSSTYIGFKTVYPDGSSSSCFGRTLDQTYPDVSRAIPAVFTTTIEVNRQDFFDCLHGEIVKFVTEDSLLRIYSYNKNGILKSSLIELQETAIDAKNTGLPVDVYYNTNYMKDAVSIMSAEEIVLQLSDDPLMIQDELMALIMPVNSDK